MFLKGKTALVTGSTSGIGLACARALAAEGAALTLNGFGEEAAIDAIRSELGAASGAQVSYSGADLTQPDQIEAMVRQAEGELGPIDILINNAGMQHVAPVQDFPPE